MEAEKGTAWRLEFELEYFALLLGVTIIIVTPIWNAERYLVRKYNIGPK